MRAVSSKPPTVTTNKSNCFIRSNAKVREDHFVTDSEEEMEPIEPQEMPNK